MVLTVAMTQQARRKNQANSPIGSLRLALLESYHQDETAPLRRPQVYGNSLPLAVVFSPNIDHVQHCSFCHPFAHHLVLNIDWFHGQKLRGLPQARRAHGQARGTRKTSSAHLTLERI